MGQRIKTINDKGWAVSRSVSVAMVDSMLSHPGGEDVRVVETIRWQVVEPVSLADLAYWLLDYYGLVLDWLLDCELLMLDWLLDYGLLVGWLHCVGGCLCHLPVASHEVSEQVNSVGDGDSLLGDSLVQDSSGLGE